MTATIAQPKDIRLDEPVRAIRRFSEHAADGLLVRATLADEPVLLADAEALVDWAGWRCPDAQHVLAPRDIVRRAEGHDVVLDDLAERLDAVCGRRAAAGEAWARGEAVTLAVAALRGVEEASDVGDEPGEWWLTCDGRPIFVHRLPGSSEGKPVVEATRLLLEAVAQGCGDRHVVRVLSEVREALARPRSIPRRAAELESLLFDAAAPQPIAVGGERPTVVREGVERTEADEGDGAGWRALLVRHVDGRIADLVVDAAGPLLARWRARRDRREARRANGPADAPTPERPPRRGRRAAVGLVAGLAVLAGGLLWPGGESPSRAAGEGASVTRGVGGEGTSAEPPPPSEEAAGDAAERAPADGGAPVSEEADPIAEAERLLAAADDCAEECPTREVAFVEDLGDIVVIRIEEEGVEPRFAAVERTDDGWALRAADAEGAG